MYELLFSLFSLACLIFLFGVYAGASRMEDKAAGYTLKSIAFSGGIFVVLFWITFMFSMSLIS